MQSIVCTIHTTSKSCIRELHSAPSSDSADRKITKQKRKYSSAQQRFSECVNINVQCQCRPYTGCLVGHVFVCAALLKLGCPAQSMCKLRTHNSCSRWGHYHYPLHRDLVLGEHTNSQCDRSPIRSPSAAITPRSVS